MTRTNFSHKNGPNDQMCFFSWLLECEIHRAPIFGLLDRTNGLLVFLFLRNRSEFVQSISKSYQISTVLANSLHFKLFFQHHNISHIFQPTMEHRVLSSIDATDRACFFLAASRGSSSASLSPSPGKENGTSGHDEPVGKRMDESRTAQRKGIFKKKRHVNRL